MEMVLVALQVLEVPGENQAKVRECLIPIPSEAVQSEIGLRGDDLAVLFPQFDGNPEAELIPLR
jgi:hypothetical protein